MTRCLAFVSAALVVVSTAAVAQDDERALRAIDSLGIRVAVTDRAAAAGISASNILSRVELEIRAGGLPTADASVVPVLAVRVASVDVQATGQVGHVFVVDLFVSEPVMPTRRLAATTVQGDADSTSTCVRAAEDSLEARVWSAKTKFAVCWTDCEEYVLGMLDLLLAEFQSAYGKANPSS